MGKIFLVGIGGFSGAISHYLVSGFVYRFVEQSWLPYGTLVVNIFGCLFIGFLNGLFESRQVFTPEVRLLIFIGFLGSFTTFSTFEFEIFNLVRDGQIFQAFSNLLLHLILGFGTVWFGYVIARLL